MDRGIKECGNSTIILSDGYWRLNRYTDIIIECSNKPENCRDSNETINYCTEGLVGPLCEECDVLGKLFQFIILFLLNSFFLKIF